MTNDYKEIASRLTPYPPETNAELAWRLKEQGYPQPKNFEAYQTWYSRPLHGSQRNEIRYVWGSLYTTVFDASGRKIMRRQLPKYKGQTLPPGDVVAILPTVKEIEQWEISKAGQPTK